MSSFLMRYFWWQAKEAASRDRQLAKQREQILAGSPANMELSFCVSLNLALRYTDADMLSEALEIYQVRQQFLPSVYSLYRRDKPGNNAEISTACTFISSVRQDTWIAGMTGNSFDLFS